MLPPPVLSDLIVQFQGSTNSLQTWLPSEQPTLKYGCPVLNLVARDFSQISKTRNIKYVSM